jgi:hypothetical protein
MRSMLLAIVLQSRGPVLQLILIYLILCTVPLGLGTCLLFAPRRAGNFLNAAFAIFPSVEPADTLKKLFYRILGIGLIWVSLFYGHQIYGNLVRPIARYLMQK